MNEYYVIVNGFTGNELKLNTQAQVQNTLYNTNHPFIQEILNLGYETVADFFEEGSGEVEYHYQNAFGEWEVDLVKENFDY